MRSDPFPARRVLGLEEKSALIRTIDAANEAGVELRYGGAEQRSYEREFAEYHGGGRARFVSSGTAALYVALAALDLLRPGEVVVPAITNAGGIMPVALSNLSPVPADTEDGSFNVSAETIRPCLTTQTRALVVAHIGGDPVRLSPVHAALRDYGVPLIEDCSQAHGASQEGRLVGTTGMVSVYSTMASKHHCTGGQGGVLLTSDEDLADRLDQCSDRGKMISTLDGSLRYLRPALNLNGTDLAAAIGRVQLRTLPGRLTKVRHVVTLLREATRDLETMHIPPAEPDSDPSYWFVRIRVDLDHLSETRDGVVTALQAEGVPATTWADIPCKQDWFAAGQSLGPGSASWLTDPEATSLTSAVKAAATHFVFFVHERWTEREVMDVASALAKVEAAFRE